MEKGRFLIETHLRTGRPIAELAAAHGVHRSWLYKLLARYRRQGEAGLSARSRRPHRSPTRIADRWEEEIVALRKELVDAGYDAGAETIHYHLGRGHDRPPSVPTIWRVLRARGFVTPQPHKRPRSSWCRFVAELPNECWQADVTHVEVADGAVFEVLNIIDDHSRLCVASRAFVRVSAADVARCLHKAAGKWGYPEAFLSDNGLVFSAQQRHNMAGSFEVELLSLGITSKRSRPYHPQTCGKVERFHQTLKRFLAKQEPAETKKQLQGQLDRFVAYYNEVRPHRGIGRRTPMAVFSAREKAYPSGPKIDVSGYRVRRDKVDKGGGVTLRHQGRLHHIGVGRAYRGWRVILLVAGREVQVLGADGSPLRRLRLDPAIDYQRML
ncbi:MAG TPA: IS481 family transposase [Acidimicrobiales bacterium]|nr:IS481 family transposase [Acidimicrobiales bacterium]